MQQITHLRHHMDKFWLLLLSLYILAGVPLVPFHGDESTLIYMGRDAYYQFVLNDWEQVLYSDPPTNATEQHIRLLNGTIPKYLYGLTGIVSGYSFENINEQWNWGLDWEQNLAEGRMPIQELLLRARFVSAMFLVGGLFALFWIADKLGGKMAAYIATLIYTLHPVILLNGRRAMMEGGLIFACLIVLVVGILLVEKRANWMYVVLGFVSGLAVATKHPAAIAVVAVFIGCQIVIVLRKDVALKNTLKLIGAGILSLLVFYILNPAWWSNPVARIPEVLELRSELITQQTEFFDSYDLVGESLNGFANHVFIAQPQYYEVDIWAEWIGDEIVRYENSLLAGIPIGGTIFGAVLLFVFLVLGLFQLQKVDWEMRIVFSIWAMLIPLAMLLTNPLNWQRYYLIIYPVVIIFTGMGVACFLERLRIYFPQLNQLYSQPTTT